MRTAGWITDSVTAFLAFDDSPAAHLATAVIFAEVVLTIRGSNVWSFLRRTYDGCEMGNKNNGMNL